MEETKWLTKGKIITFVVIVLIVIGIITGVLIHRNNLKKDYIKYEKQLEYAAPNYLLKEKIKLYEYEWREINVTDILKQKLVINKKSSDCSGYVIAEALKDDTLDLEESTSNVSEDNNEASTTESSSDKENKTNKRISSNIKYKAYITCKKIYTTEGYGTKPDSENKNTDKTQTQKDTEKPVIELFGDTTITLKFGENYNELGAVATDNVDGDLTKKIKISGKVDTQKAGEYIVKYTVTDKAGNKTTIERKVIVEEKKEEIKEEEPKDNTNNNNNNTNNSNNSNNSNNNNNNNNNYYYRDTTAPIITFNNSDTLNICVGGKVDISVNGPYGYAAWDNVDGNITSRVRITGDTGVINSAGTYYLYYTVSDSSGNKTNESRKFFVGTCGNPIKRPDPVISVTSIELTPCNDYIKNPINRGQHIQFSATVYPSSATNKSVTYSSSNSNVASVTQNGYVTGLSSGITSIIATSADGKIKGACKVKVN